MVKVTEKYGIEFDPMNIMVVRLDRTNTKKNRDGTVSEYFPIIGFFSTLGGALKKISNLEIVEALSGENMDLREAMEIYARKMDNIAERLARFK